MELRRDYHLSNRAHELMCAKVAYGDVVAICHIKSITRKQKRNKTMSKYRFAGTIREIAVETGNVILKFIPDQEFVSSYKKDKDVTTYALLQPDDDKDMGWVFKFAEYVYLVVSKSTPCHYLTGNLHCSLELDATSGSGICDVVFSDIQACTVNPPPLCKFAITSVRTF